MLFSKKARPLVSNYCGIELCETVHFHMPGFRFELDLGQFESFARAMARAYENWLKMGKPGVDPERFILLGDCHMPGEPVYNTRFDIEEQTIPSVHIHLRGLSIRKSIQDFIEFANAVWEARKNLTTNQS
jgi:hypothetical protein